MNNLNETQEKYIYFVNCIDSLNTAWRILNKIKEEKGNPLSYFAFQFALIEYSKSYKDANSAFKNEKGKPVKKHKLATDFIPPKSIVLHSKIIDARDQILAHLDLDIRDAKIYIQNTERGKNIIRSQNILNLAKEMEDIDEIINLIEETIVAMEKEIKTLGDNLPANI